MFLVVDHSAAPFLTDRSRMEYRLRITRSRMFLTERSVILDGRLARPVEFDPESALSAAIKVFSDQGYEGSSTADLLASMGIARQSLYGAFGDKRRLFLKALESYNAGSIAEQVSALRSRQDSLEALESALLAFARPGARPEAGCLGLGSITEFGRSDPDVNAINEPSARTLIAALPARVRARIAACAIRDFSP